MLMITKLYSDKSLIHKFLVASKLLNLGTIILLVIILRNEISPSMPLIFLSIVYVISSTRIMLQFKNQLLSIKLIPQDSIHINYISFFKRKTTVLIIDKLIIDGEIGQSRDRLSRYSSVLRFRENNKDLKFMVNGEMFLNILTDLNEMETTNFTAKLIGSLKRMMRSMNINEGTNRSRIDEIIKDAESRQTRERGDSVSK